MSASRTLTFLTDGVQIPSRYELGRSPNTVRTSRFNLLNWIPKSLFLQFHRLPNWFFLFVTVLSFLPFTPTNPSSIAGPFIGVLFFTCCKDWYEDVRKQRDDRAENMRAVRRYDHSTQSMVEVACKDLAPGDIVVTYKDESLPADMLVLKANEGQSYLSTGNLDGEANLKIRVPPDLVSGVADVGAALAPQNSTSIQSLPSLSEAGRVSSMKIGLAEAAVECKNVLNSLANASVKIALDEPVANLAEFGGVCTCDKSATRNGAPAEGRLAVDHFMPRGCVQRNTSWCVSVIAYAGVETKTFLNIVPSPGKLSQLQHAMNYAVAGLITGLIIFCLYLATISEYKQTLKKGFGVTFLVYWIVLYQIVPISLYVCFELLKIILGLRINMDKQMVEPVSGVGAFARTADLVEELGQVSYLFSDKTGTLTENEMIFAKCMITRSLLDTELGDFRHSSSEDAKVPAGVKQSLDLMAKNGDQARDILWYWQCLAVCNNIQVEKDEVTGEPTYAGSSSDEVAFLLAAKKVGIVLTKREKLPGNEWKLTIQHKAGSTFTWPAANLEEWPAGTTSEFTVLGEISFTSERRRISVLCEFEGDIYILSKGADSSMEPLCSEKYPPQMQTSLASYSNLGLRTLVVASRKLDRTEFNTWREAQSKAGNQEEKDKAATILEHSMSAVGITAIEDQLQDGVPEALDMIQQMGIRVWVLTGDKIETAVEIGRSCKLFRADSTPAYAVNPSSEKECLAKLEAALKQIVDRDDDVQRGFVFDGVLMKFVMESTDAADALYKLACVSKVCMGCRLSPAQKRYVVELVKKRKRDAITMSIGDGANDVSMIQGAHVGIGIRGKEGLQAVQVSDIAISKFRFLWPLLMCHGRRNYRRVAVFLCYYLYKHFILSMGEAIWAHQYSFCGCIAYSEWLSAAYNVAFSSLPILVAQSVDTDLPDEFVMKRPYLYEEGLRRTWFNPPVFVGWMLTGVWHGTVAWLVPALIISSPEFERGVPGDASMDRTAEFWSVSLSAFSLLVIFIQVRLLVVSMNPCNKFLLGSIAFTVVCYIVVLFLLGETPLGDVLDVQYDGVPTTMFSSARHLLVILLVPFALAIDFVVIRILRRTKPGPLFTERNALGYI